MSAMPFDALEQRDPAEREAALFAALVPLLQHAGRHASAAAAQLSGIDPAQIRSRAELAKLPVIRTIRSAASPRSAGVLAPPQVPARCACSSHPARSTNRRAIMLTTGAPRGRCTPPVLPPATWCTTASATTSHPPAR
jgi:hypothetical protein